MTTNHPSQDDNGAEKSVAGSELLPLSCPSARGSFGKKRNVTAVVRCLLAPFHQATTHSKGVSFLRLTTQGLILLFPFASNHSPLACLLDSIYAGLNIWLTLEQIGLPKLGNL